MCWRASTSVRRACGLSHGRVHRRSSSPSHLDDAGVVDGALLTVVTVSRTERYRPLVEDVIDAIAVLDETPEFDRRALYRFVGLVIPLVTLMITVMSILSWSRHRA